MERLTKIFEDGPTKVLTICQARCGDAIVWREWSISKDAAIEESLMRLAAYEDTGMEPEEIKELSELKTSLTAAEQNMLNDYLGLGSVASLRELAEADRDGRCVVLPCKVGDTVYRIQYISDGTAFVKIGVVEHRFDVLFYAMEHNNFGKTVFLTRPEAEEALKGGTA